MFHNISNRFILCSHHMTSNVAERSNNLKRSTRHREIVFKSVFRVHTCFNADHLFTGTFTIRGACGNAYFLLDQWSITYTDWTSRTQCHAGNQAFFITCTQSCTLVICILFANLQQTTVRQWTTYKNKQYRINQFLMFIC